MGFSTEWDTAYKAGTQLSIWPWTDQACEFGSSLC